MVSYYYSLYKRLSGRLGYIFFTKSAWKSVGVSIRYCVGFPLLGYGYGNDQVSQYNRAQPIRRADEWKSQIRHLDLWRHFRIQSQHCDESADKWVVRNHHRLASELDHIVLSERNRYFKNTTVMKMAPTPLLSVEAITAFWVIMESNGYIWYSYIGYMVIVLKQYSLALTKIFAERGWDYRGI